VSLNTPRGQQPASLGDQRSVVGAELAALNQRAQSPPAGAVPSNFVPARAGVGHPGLSDEMSRQDHVHPGAGAGDGAVSVWITDVNILDVGPSSLGVMGGGDAQKYWHGPPPAGSDELGFDGIPATCTFPTGSAWAAQVTVNGTYINGSDEVVTLRIRPAVPYQDRFFRLAPSGVYEPSFSWTYFVSLPGDFTIAFTPALLFIP
jgi:hypothetical protein